MLNTFVPAAQRRALRRSLYLECQVVREHDFRLIGEEAFDVSQDGMLITTSERVLTGEELLVTFRLPNHSMWFDTDATVARVVHGRRPYDPGRCLGISFGSLDRAARWFLRSSLRGLPPPLPARQPRIDYAATVHSIALS